jgi:hypothetical protein
MHVLLPNFVGFELTFKEARTRRWWLVLSMKTLSFKHPNCFCGSQFVFWTQAAALQSMEPTVRRSGSLHTCWQPTDVLGATDSSNFRQIFDFNDQGWGSNKARRTHWRAVKFLSTHHLALPAGSAALLFKETHLCDDWA